MPLQLDKTDEKSEVPVVLNMSAYNSTLQNPCQSSVHNGHKQRTVQTELQHYCYVSCKVFTSSSHLMPTFQHKMRNMESRNYMKLSLSLYLYIYMACIVSSFFAEIMGNLRGPSYIFHFTTTLSIHADTGEVPQASATFGRETAVPPTVCVVFLCFFWMGLMGFFASIPGGQVEKVNLLDFQNYTWPNFEDASHSS